MRKISSSSRKVKVNQKQKDKKSSAKSSVYKVKNWSEYNRVLKQRGNLTVWFSQEAIQKWYYEGPTHRGAQFKYSDLAIETALTLKAIYHLPLRQTEGFLQSIVELLDLGLEVPDFSTISRRQAGLDIRLPVWSSNEPVYVVVDSTGLKVYGEGEWKVRQHGYSKRRTWRKLHLGVDEATGEILAIVLTTNDVDDASCVHPLLNQIRRPISALGGDGAYDKQKVYDTLAHPPQQSQPIVPVIPPRRDAKIEQHGNSAKPPLPRDENLRAIRKQGWKKWKQQSGYHRRSIAEAGVSRYKRIIGPKLQARTLSRQKVEAQIGCTILNHMLHLGRPTSYKVQIAA